MMTAMHRCFAQRLAGRRWADVAASLDREGWAPLPQVFEAAELDALVRLVDQHSGPEGALFDGEDDRAGLDIPLPHDLPEPLRELQRALREHLQPIAQRWAATLDPVHAGEPAVEASAGPASAGWLSRLHAGQCQALHEHGADERDLPLQLVALLSEPDADFTGGDFLMTERRPRMQSRPIVLPLRRGDAAIIAVGPRPFKGARGHYRVDMMHGVGRVRSGQRLGLELLMQEDAATREGAR